MQPITFTRTDDQGKPRTRIAYTPAEAVKLRFDGWTEGGPAPKSSTAAAADKPAADKSAKS